MKYFVKTSQQKTNAHARSRTWTKKITCRNLDKCRKTLNLADKGSAADPLICQAISQDSWSEPTDMLQDDWLTDPQLSSSGHKGRETGESDQPWYCQPNYSFS